MGQIEKVTQIAITDSTIVINDSTILSYPMNIDELLGFFGEARTDNSPQSPNKVYYWDHLGIMIFTRKGKEDVTSFEVCLSRSSIGPNTRRKFRGKLIVRDFVISKKTRIEDLKNAGFQTQEPDKILNSYQTLQLRKMRIIVETERKDKRTTGIGVSTSLSW